MQFIGQRSLVVLALLLATTICVSLPDFADYAVQFNKTYNVSETNTRHAIYMIQVAELQALAKTNITYNVGVNNYSDSTDAEIACKFTGLFSPQRTQTTQRPQSIGIPD